MNGKILIVDDSPADILFLTKLMKNTEFEFTSLNSITEALEYLKDNTPLAIILDYMLPDGDSMSIIDKYHNTYPIVLLTGMEDPEIGLTAVKKGAQDFLTKGFINKDLLKKSIKYSIERQSLKKKVSSAEKMATLGRMSSGVAHEMNTPIQYVSDNLYFLEKEFSGVLSKIGQIKELSPDLGDETYRLKLNEIVSDIDFDFLRSEIPDAVQQSLHGMDKISRLVKALKSYASNETTEVKKIDVNDVIDNCIGRCTGISEQIQINFNPGIDLKSILVEERNLEQVIDIILENAVYELKRKFTENESIGIISIATNQNDHSIEITISDNGDGIPEDLIDKIFDPFFTTKGFEGNLGQGLAMAHRIVHETFEGTIKVISPEGKGAQFIINIPHLKI